MGRSINRFSQGMGHTLEINDDRITLPEKDLWVAVLARAALDAFKGPPELDMSNIANIPHKNQYTYDRNQARHFFMRGGSHFNEVCEMAGRNPVYIREKARKIILRKEGWNVDVSIASRSRQGRGRKQGRPGLYGV